MDRGPPGRRPASWIPIRRDAHRGDGFGGNLQAYNADSGFRSVGLAARASYGLTDDWTFHVQGGYDRLIGDAADSPITERGSENQFTLGAGVTYRFAFDVFE